MLLYGWFKKRREIFFKNIHSRVNIKMKNEKAACIDFYVLRWLSASRDFPCASNEEGIGYIFHVPGDTFSSVVCTHIFFFHLNSIAWDFFFFVWLNESRVIIFIYWKFCMLTKYLLFSISKEIQLSMFIFGPK